MSEVNIPKLKLVRCINGSLLLIVFLSMLLLSGCGKDTQSSSNTQPNWNIGIGTHQPGVAYHSAGAGLAGVVSSNSKVQMSVVPFTGFKAWMPLLNKGELEIGLIPVAGARFALMGEDGYEKNKNIRSLVFGNDIVTAGFTVRADSGIKSISDLKGKRVASGYSGDSSALVLEIQLKSVGLTWDDVQKVPVADTNTGLAALREKRVDAAFTGLPTVAGFLEVHQAVGLRALNLADTPANEINNISKEFKNQMQSIYPGTEPVVYKGGFVEEDTILIKYPLVLIASAKLSDEVAYEVTKTLFENYEKLKPTFVWFQTWEPKRMFNNNPSVPYHEGAVKYFKEQGLWNNEIEQRQQELLKLTQ